MALRASNSLPAKAYDDIKAVAVQLERLAQARAASWASGGDAFEVIAALDIAVAFKDRLQSLASTPGLATYAQEQENDPTYDVVAEYNALITAIDNFITEIVNTMPVSNPGGYIEQFSLNADGSKTVRTFTGAQLSGVIATLNAIDAAIS